MPLNDEGIFMSHIFISYSHKDKTYAHKLHRHLLDQGFEAWIDDRIDYGSRWSLEIERQLTECAAFILVMSPNSYASDWVQNELSFVRELKKPIFPLLLEGNVWWHLQTTQFVNVAGGKLPPTKFFVRLAEITSPYKVDAHLGGKSIDTKINKSKKISSTSLDVGSNVSGSVVIAGNGNVLFLGDKERESTEKATREQTEKESPEKARVGAEELARQKATKERAKRESYEKNAREKEGRETVEKAIPKVVSAFPEDRIVESLKPDIDNSVELEISPSKIETVKTASRSEMSALVQQKNHKKNERIPLKMTIPVVFGGVGLLILICAIFGSLTALSSQIKARNATNTAESVNYDATIHALDLTSTVDVESTYASDLTSTAYAVSMTEIENEYNATMAVLYATSTSVYATSNAWDITTTANAANNNATNTAEARTTGTAVAAQHTQTAVFAVMPSSVPMLADSNVAMSQYSTAINLMSRANETYTDDDYAKPGMLTYTVSLSSSDQILWQTNWCTTTKDILESNLSSIIIKFVLDGRDVSSQVLSIDSTDSNVKTQECRRFYFLLSDWPSGQHYLTSNMTIMQNINDGVADFAPGEYVINYLVDAEP